MTTEISERLVESLGATYGVHPGFRAAHAKGVLCAATFTPTAAAAALSRAPHFDGPPVRAHVRFSNGSGDPTAPDSARDGRGMAVKFALPDGSTTDLVAISLPGVLRADAGGPARVQRRAARRSRDRRARCREGRRVSRPSSRGGSRGHGRDDARRFRRATRRSTYHGIHAFAFTNAAGRRAARSLSPACPRRASTALTDEEAAAADADYLQDELVARLARGPRRRSPLQVELAGGRRSGRRSDRGVARRSRARRHRPARRHRARVRSRARRRHPRLRSDPASRRHRGDQRRDPAGAQRRVPCLGHASRRAGDGDSVVAAPSARVTTRAA